MSQSRSRLRTALATVLTGLMAGSVVVTAAAAPPTTDSQPAYDSYPAIADPGTSAPDYYQPLWYAADAEGSSSGTHIQAHGGQIVTTQENGRTVYYWYGEDRSNDYYNSPGVHAYRSTDSYNWVDMGVVLASVNDRAQLTEPDGYFDRLYGTVASDGTVDEEKVNTLFRYLNVKRTLDDGTTQLNAIFERPKVLYNAKNDQWVMWWHSDGNNSPTSGSNYARSLAAVAVSDSPTGPFTMIGAYRMPNRADYKACTQYAVPGQARDMTVFQDEDGSAYIVYSSEENYSLYIARLNDDYTNVTHTTDTDMSGQTITDGTRTFPMQYSASGEYPYLFADGSADAPVRGVDFQIVRECGHLEAPALFASGGRYYAVTSGATGWAPNQQTYYTSTDLIGTPDANPWIRGVLPDDPYENVAYNSIPEGGDGYMSIGDVRRTTFGSQSTNVFALDPAKSQYVYMGDRWHAGAADSTYVWLPIVFGENGALLMANPAMQDARWANGWTPEYWTENGGAKGASASWSVELPQTLDQVVRTGQDIAEVLPATVTVDENGTARDVPVTWDAKATDNPGTVQVRGTLGETTAFYQGRVFYRSVTVEAYGKYNIAPEATVTASSRADLAATVNDGSYGKGWDDWVGGGNHPRHSTLDLTWSEPRDVDTVVVHTYLDGTASWPSTISIQYRDALTGEWTASDVSASVSRDSSAGAPVVRLDTSSLPATSSIRVVLDTDVNVWQSISEIEAIGYAPAASASARIASDGVPLVGESSNLARASGTEFSVNFEQTEWASNTSRLAVDGNTTAKGWSTWAANASTIDPVGTFTFASDAVVDDVTIHYFKDGRASWPQSVTVEYLGAGGEWTACGSQSLTDDASGPAPVVTISCDGAQTGSVRVVNALRGTQYINIAEIEVEGIDPAASRFVVPTEGGTPGTVVARAEAGVRVQVEQATVERPLATVTTTQVDVDGTVIHRNVYHVVYTAADADHPPLLSATDKGSLQSSILAAQPIVADGSQEWTEATWKELAGALDSALDVLFDPEVSQEQVDDAASTLANALDRLRPVMPTAVAGAAGTRPADVLYGDWDGDGRGSYALRSGDRVTFWNDNGADAQAAYSISVGKGQVAVFAGDWDGDGVTTLAVLNRGGTVSYLDATGETVTSGRFSKGALLTVVRDGGRDVLVEE